MIDDGSFLNKAFGKFLFAYVLVNVLLPSGSIYGFNFKYPLYLGLFPLALYAFLKSSRSLYPQLVVACTVLGVLSIWTVLGLCYGFDANSALRQCTDIFLTFFSCWLVSVFCGSEEMKQLKYLGMVVNAVAITSLLKIGIIAYALARGIPLTSMVLLLDKIFGVELITMDFDSLLGRFQFVSDEVIPIAIFILLRHRDRLRIDNLRASIMILLMAASVLFSFSRYFWAFTALAFLLGIALGRRDKFKIVLIVVLGLSFAASLPTLIDLYTLRFSRTVTSDSDDLRVEQTRALQDTFFQAPLFGHGLGSYTTTVIRSNTEADRYSYEVQLLALSTQVGLVGLSFLLALTAYFYQGLWRGGKLAFADRIGIFLLLAFWIAAGFTNPLLFSSVAAVNYAALAALTGIVSRTRPLIGSRSEVLS
jgi:hypothetical protein